MISLYTGTPGSGKSLHVAERMKTYLELFKDPVISNFQFKAYMCNCKGYGSFFYVPNANLKVDFLINFSDKLKEKKKVQRLKEDTILLVIDEAQIIFNSRSWNDNKNERLKWISFFSQHRKLGYHVILVAQYDEMLDKQIRPLIEYQYDHRKIANIGIYGKFLNMITGGNLHLVRRIYYPVAMDLGKEFFKGNEKLFYLYDSYTRFSDKTDPAGLRSGTAGSD